MTFKYTDLGPGDLGSEPDYSDYSDDAKPNPVDLLPDVWAYLVDHSPMLDAAILDLLAGANVSHIPWTPVMHELADAVNEVLKQKTD